MALGKAEGEEAAATPRALRSTRAGAGGAELKPRVSPAPPRPVQ